MAKHTAAEYRAMAERCLSEAAQSKDPEFKAALLEIASRYDWIADWVERQERAAAD